MTCAASLSMEEVLLSGPMAAATSMLQLVCFFYVCQVLLPFCDVYGGLPTLPSCAWSGDSAFDQASRWPWCWPCWLALLLVTAGWNATVQLHMAYSSLLITTAHAHSHHCVISFLCGRWCEMLPLTLGC